mmetsp:Transcript_17646/g.54964  ORF Transcript_17646/g.54964 Transcript_17646/m.54964 type:complete len:369 (-) Transcript_17646:662-1768(-)
MWSALALGTLAALNGMGQVLDDWDPVEVVDERFKDLVDPGAKLTRVAWLENARTEGPAWVWQVGALSFTTGNCPTAGDWDDTYIIGNSTNGNASPMLRHSNHSNGQTIDFTGLGIVACETTGRRVSMVRVDEHSRFSARKTIVDNYRGKPLNSPNDVVIKSDGTVWFTDPSYGCIQFPDQECVLPGDVYRYDPKKGELSVVYTGLDKPNGLAFSLDEKRMYVVDSGAMHADFDPTRPHCVYEFDVEGEGAGCALTNRRLFADITPGIPDGLKLDNFGNVYVAAGDGVQVFDPEGTLLGKIHTPPYPSSFAHLTPGYGQCSNLETGGAPGTPPFPHYRRHVFYIAAGPGVYAITLKSSGGDRPMPPSQV